MQSFDWIVIGGGITGAAIGYELSKKGFSVLVLEQYGTAQNATRYSYGGLAYWSGTTELTRQLCSEGIARHRILSQELDGDTQFRELDLILTIDADDDPEQAAAAYRQLAVQPELLSIAEACKMEPLLNPQAIAGALTLRHGHIQPEMTALAYSQATIRAGGAMQIDRVVGFVRENQRIAGVTTPTTTYYSENVVVCAGGFSRMLLRNAGINVRVYFTHAETIETPPVDLQLSTCVKPAQLKRFQLEADAGDNDALWDETGYEVVPPILDPGAFQFQDGSIRMGQISRAIADPHAKVDPTQSEADMRAQVSKLLPTVGNLPGTWHNCLVAFGPNRLPVVGKIPGFEGIYLFSGFTNPLVFVPPLAQRFANWVSGENDPIITQLSPVVWDRTKI
jgi:glycine/D-amino acid oxidase-like deaminating enzyme